MSRALTTMASFLLPGRYESETSNPARLDCFQV